MEVFWNLGTRTIRRCWGCVAILFAILLSQPTVAAPTTMTLQGRIVKTDGSPLEYNNVSFLFQITDPSGTCVLYQEQLTGYDMSNSRGVFDAVIGLGARSFPTGPTFTVIDSLNNNAPLSCQGGATYTPAFDDGRKLRVRFHDGNGWKLISPDNVIRAVPYAGYSVLADSATKLGNYAANDFVLKNLVPICSANTFLSWNGSALTCENVMGLSGGTVTNVSGSGPIAVANGGTTPAISISKANTSTDGYLSAGDWNIFDSKLGTSTAFVGDISGTYNTTVVEKIKNKSVVPVAYAPGQVLRYDGTNWVNALLTGSDIPALDWSSITTGKPTSLNGYGITDAVNKNGDTMTGTLNMSGNDISSVGNILLNAQRSLRLGSYTDAQEGTLVGGLNATHKGSTWYNTDQNQIKYWNGSGVVTLSGVGSYLTGLSGDVVAVGPGSVVATISNNAVTTAKILDGNVTGAKLENVSSLTAGSYGSATAIPAITVDAKGRVTALTTNSITSVPAAGADDKFLRSSLGAWVTSDIKVNDIKNGVGASVFSTSSCLINQMFSWNSLTDTFTCQDIGALDASKITTGTFDVNRLPASVKYWQGGGAGAIYYNSGNVGIGVVAPGEKLEVAGNIKATSVLLTSDERLKYDVHNIKKAVDMVMKLKGVHFKWKANAKEDIGFIAQQIEQVLPQLVHTDPVSGFKSVQYANVVAILVAAIQEQQTAFEKLNRRLDEQALQIRQIQSDLRPQRDK